MASMQYYGKLKALLPHMESAFQSFYEILLSDAKFAGFFKGPDHIKELLIKQRNGFVRALELERNEFIRYYEGLGRMHYDISIPYVDFLRGTQILHDTLMRHAFQSRLGEEIYECLSEYTKETSNLVAKGYLERVLTRDVLDLQSFRTFLEANPSPISEQCRSELKWIEDLIQAVQEESTEHVAKSSLPESFLAYDDGRRPFLTEDSFLRIQRDIESIFYFIEKKIYADVLPLYMSLLNVYKIILFASNSLSWTQNVKLSEEALQARLSSQELSVFAGMMAHDLKNPLGTIQVLGELIHSDPDDEAANQKYLEYILKVVGQMNGLIEALADYMRATHQNVKKEKILLSEVWDDVKVRLNASISETNADLSPADPHPIFADRILLASALQNLVSNSLKYKSEATPVIRIRIDPTETEDIIVVSDNGEGIKSEDRERVFERFRRCSNKSTGSGLGLSFVRIIMEKHQGRVWFESEPGKGSSFHLAFPRSSVAA